MSNYWESKKLREERGSVIQDMQAISKAVAEENRSMTGDEIERFDRLDKSQEDLKSKIDSAERIEKSSAMMVSQPASKTPYTGSASKVITRQDHATAIAGWLLRQQGLNEMVRSEHQAAADKVGLDLTNSVLRVSILDDAPENLAEIRRTDPTTALTNEAYTEGSSIASGVVSAMKSFGGMKTGVHVFSTPNANPFTILKENDTTTLAAARATLGAIASANQAFDKVVMGGYGVASGVYPIAKENLRDSAAQILPIAFTNIGKRLARKANAWATSGAGTTEPVGLESIAPTFLYPSTYVDWYDVLVSMQESIDDGYNVNRGFVFSKNVRKELRSAIGADGRPLWNRDWTRTLAVGSPDTLLDDPYYVNNDMGDWNVTSKGVVFYGDLDQFYWREVGSVDIQVLRELYAVNQAVALIGTYYMDSAVIDSAALCSACAGNASNVNCGVIVSA